PAEVPACRGSCLPRFLPAIASRPPQAVGRLLPPGAHRVPIARRTRHRSRPARRTMRPSGAGGGMLIVDVVLGILAFGGLVAGSGLRVVRQFERGVVFRFGRLMPNLREPWLTRVVPSVD